MKSLYKWFCSSTRNKLVALGYLVIVILFVNIKLGYNTVKTSIEQNKSEKAELDPNIMVKGQSIYIHGEEVYKFLPVQGGSLSIVDSHNQRRTLTVKSFLMGEIPVSNRLQAYLFSGKVVTDKYSDFYFDFPANNGTIDNWNTFINILNKKTGHKFRLPTNDEWEYAARGGKASLNYKYAGGNDINEVAIYKGNCKGFGLFVCRDKKPNELGFYDMSGCIWEVTSTIIEDAFRDVKIYNRIFKDSISDIAKANIVRGGSYDSPAEECELDYVPSKTIIKTGARLVMEY